MKKITLLLWVFFLCLNIHGQSVSNNKKSFQLIEQRKIHLNGANKAAFVPGAKARTYIQIDLPPNTIEWYYSFSTSNNQESNERLNLMIQIGGILAANSTTIGSVLNSSGITQSALSAIKIPPGSHAIDSYLLDENNIKKFLSKDDTWQYYMQGSATNITEGIIKVNSLNKGTWFIGLKNLGYINAVDIIIEAVAIVSE